MGIHLPGGQGSKDKDSQVIMRWKRPEIYKGDYENGMDKHGKEFCSFPVCVCPWPQPWTFCLLSLGSRGLSSLIRPPFKLYARTPLSWTSGWLLRMILSIHPRKTPDNYPVESLNPSSLQETSFILGQHSGLSKKVYSQRELCFWSPQEPVECCRNLLWLQSLYCGSQLNSWFWASKTFSTTSFVWFQKLNRSCTGKALNVIFQGEPGKFLELACSWWSILCCCTTSI